MRNSSFPEFESLPSAADLKLAAEANRGILQDQELLTPEHETSKRQKRSTSRDQMSLIKECPDNEGDPRR